MLVISPNSKNSNDIPNIDSTVFDFDNTNLFVENRFVGYDRVETGSRLSYGLKWSIFNNSAKNQDLSFLFGQVYRWHETDEKPPIDMDDKIVEFKDWPRQSNTPNL